MKHLSPQLPDSSKQDAKPDPFVLADFDQLATEIIEEMDKEQVNREQVKKLAMEIKLGAERFTLFLIEAGLQQEP
jgi:hypothetical protein